MRLNKVIIITLLSLFALSCSKNREKGDISGNKIEIFSTILPVQYFIDRIGGEFIESKVLVGPGKNPATYQPTPKQIVSLSKADILFTIGVPFEKAYLDKTISTLVNLKVIDASEGVEKREISNHNHDEEEDHEELNSDHDELDPHTWLSPILAKTISKNILETLINIDEKNKAVYKNNYNILLEELDNIDLYNHSKLDILQGRTVYVYHPSFGYFLDDFNIIQEAVETGGKEPTPQQLERLISMAREEGVKIIVVQPEFSIKSATVIADAIGGKVEKLNPLGYDYFTNLKIITDSISEAYRQ